MKETIEVELGEFSHPDSDSLKCFVVAAKRHLDEIQRAHPEASLSGVVSLTIDTPDNALLGRIEGVEEPADGKSENPHLDLNEEEDSFLQRLEASIKGALGDETVSPSERVEIHESCPSCSRCGRCGWTETKFQGE